jgi:hypothetical protein
MIETLRTGRGLWGKYYLCSLKFCIFGRRRMCFLNRLVLVTSLFVLLFLVKWFILYTSCILRGALRFQWDWLLLKKKKKLYIIHQKKF